MGKVQHVPLVALVAGITFAGKEFLTKAEKMLVDEFGPLEMESSVFHFNMTDYYAAEMGEHLKKCFYCFSRLIGRERLADIKLMTNEIEMVRRSCEQYRVSVESVHCDMEILDPPSLDIFRKAKEVILSNLDTTVALNAKILVIHAYIFADPENIIVDDAGGLHPGLSVFKGLGDKNSGMLERVKEGMRFYAEEAKKRGIKIALETDSQMNEMLPDIVSDIDPEGCGICFDSGHAERQEGATAAEAAKLLAPWVICTHMNDNYGEKDLHLPPFEGIIDWKGTIAGLLEGGYKGNWTFECRGNIGDITAARDKLHRLIMDFMDKKRSYNK